MSHQCNKYGLGATVEVIEQGMGNGGGEGNEV